MSIVTFVGVLLGTLLISVAIIRGGSALIFLNMDAAFITIGGTIAATLIAYPFKDVRRVFHVALNAFKKDIYPPRLFITTILNLAQIYRRGGLKKLETEEESLNNRFFRTGVELVVDGFNQQDIHSILEKERLYFSLRHESGEMIIRTMAKLAPAFGMAGTLIGLIQMMAVLNDPQSIGRPLAQAMVSTFYGLLLANLVLLPIAAKLKTRTDNELVLMRVIMDGVSGIHRKENPVKLERHLNSILPPNQRT
ncbi:Flagellar motor rotation protein MotA [hydrothermal vent metagenome]|uniref:Flagellar motor rotation protein MotA n=1 Tax=hydrothermal vent metagenome TaxID=652676 RepID=A0A3B0V986_9ZZZZ